MLLRRSVGARFPLWSSHVAYAGWWYRVPGHSVVNEYLVFVLGKETVVHAVGGSIAGLKYRLKTQGDRR